MAQRQIIQLGALTALVFVLPVATYFLLPYLPGLRTLSESTWPTATFPHSAVPFEQATVGPGQVNPSPLITHVQIIDFDQDGISDVIACDARQHCVFWYRQADNGQWEEHTLGSDLPAPSHATVVDLDLDGDRDVLVSILGNIQPDDGLIGRVVLLENTPEGFQPQTLLDDVRRVADVQAGDLDGDGDLDLAVAVFGFGHGQILWLENHGEFRFEERQLLAAPGTIHIPLADYDGDGDMDIAAVVSQTDEQVWAFENLGGGRFAPRQLYATPNFDLGSAGLFSTDLDSDGDVDLILPVGDNLEDLYSYPQPYHGCFWLENTGDWEFVEQRIANFGGTYAAAAGDLDGDDDQDIVLVSMLNGWNQRKGPTMVWLENDGQQKFRSWAIADQPTHLVTVACGDLNGDDRDDIVAGGLHLWKSFDRLGRITSWKIRGAR